MRRNMTAVLLLLCFTVACSSRTLTISDSNFTRNIKTILVLPVYSSEVMIPPLPAPLKEMDFDEAERKTIYGAVMKSSPFFQQSADAVLSRGKFSVRTVSPDVKDRADIFKEVRFRAVPLKIDKNRMWPLNFEYGLDGQTIQKLLNTHNADAVLFHYIQANKRLYTHSWSGYRVTYHVTLPIWYLEYSAVMYDKNGRAVFSKTRRILQMENLKDNGNGRYGSTKIHPGDMHMHLMDEENVQSEMYKKRGSFYRDFVKI